MNKEIKFLRVANKEEYKEIIRLTKQSLEMKKLNWYEFTQNNSGGYFDVDDQVCHRVYIEAEDIEEACDKAYELGVYFDGVEKGLDCGCCRDRWSSPWGELTFPEKNYKDNSNLENIVDYVQYISNEYSSTYPAARIYYANGEVKEIISSTFKKPESK